MGLIDPHLLKRQYWRSPFILCGSKWHFLKHQWWTNEGSVCVCSPRKLMRVILTHVIGIEMHCWIASLTKNMGLNDPRHRNRWASDNILLNCLASLTSMGLNDPRHRNRWASVDIWWRLINKWYWVKLTFTFIQGHTDLNHENNKCSIISETF